MNPERLRALEKWQKENQIKLAQVNGQRKYGGPPDGEEGPEWEGPVPGGGCEVFISQFPRETYEDQLMPLFSDVGPLWEFRLMMNFSGQNRGFAYAKYGTRALAAAAVSRLHGYEVEPGVCLNVRHSTEKRQLCVGELPANTQWTELLRVLMNLTEGVEGLSLKSGPDIIGVSALVVYVSHHAASMAKKVLGEGFKKLFSLRVSVNWQPSYPKDRTPAGDDARETPPRLRHRQTPASPFNRAPGAVVSPLPPPPCSAPATMPLVPEKAPSAFCMLQQLCEVWGGAKPTMRLEFSHMDAGGLLHVAYDVRLPGLAQPFRGTVATVLGASTAGTLQQVRQLAAGQVLIQALMC